MKWSWYSGWKTTIFTWKTRGPRSFSGKKTRHQVLTLPWEVWIRPRLTRKRKWFLSHCITRKADSFLKHNEGPVQGKLRWQTDTGQWINDKWDIIWYIILSIFVYTYNRGLLFGTPPTLTKCDDSKLPVLHHFRTGFQSCIVPSLSTWPGYKISFDLPWPISTFMYWHLSKSF